MKNGYSCPNAKCQQGFEWGGFMHVPFVVLCVLVLVCSIVFCLHLTHFLCEVVFGLSRSVTPMVKLPSSIETSSGCSLLNAQVATLTKWNCHMVPKCLVTKQHVQWLALCSMVQFAAFPWRATHAMLPSANKAISQSRFVTREVSLELHQMWRCAILPWHVPSTFVTLCVYHFRTGSL